MAKIHKWPLAIRIRHAVWDVLSDESADNSSSQLCRVRRAGRADETAGGRKAAGGSNFLEPAGGGELNAAESEGATDTLGEADFPRIDVDLSRQMLSVFDESGNVKKVLPISSGSGRWYVSEGERRQAITPTGRFRVYRKISGWRKSPLGLMYYPVYIVGGVAIHGSPSVPRRPASHGCIRIPMRAAKAFYDTTPIGTVVLVHW